MVDMINIIILEEIMGKLNEKVKYTTISCITNAITNWKLYAYEKSLYEYDRDSK